jgi:sulfite exporter TauE/SafE
VVWGPLRAGAVNGLLPCGLVYPAALTAAALGNPSSTALFMLGFGAGTLPAMVGLSYGLALFPSRLRAHLRRLTPAALTLTGVLLIVQGIAPATGGNHVHVMTR